MEFDVVCDKFNQALDSFMERDRYLLEHGISERAIAHRLAVYLEPGFDGFNVDCEYNGNVDDDSGRKYLHILRARAKELKLAGVGEEDEDIGDRLVYPDIIVHRRGQNGEGNNILVVELKKSSNPDFGDWDIEKLVGFTSGAHGNSFSYEYGAFIRFTVGAEPAASTWWFRNGERIA